MKVAMLTTVGDRCGIAAYTRSLVEALGEFADIAVEPIQEGKQPLSHYQEQADRLNQADVVHIQHEHSFWGGILPNKSAFWNLRYLIKKPVVLTAHTTTALADLLKLREERRPLHRFAKQILVWRTAYRDSIETAPFIAGRCIVHTEAARNELVERGANPKYIHVLPAGVPTPLVSPDKGAAFRGRFGLGERRVVSLFGYIAPNKGYELTLDILPKLPEDVVFVIAGGLRTSDLEPYAAGLQERINAAGLKDRVVITGYLSEQEVADAIAASAVVVAPHTFATGSYSIMVPLSYGKAIVSSNLDCFKEINDQVQCLSLFQAGNAADYAAKLNAVLREDSLRSGLAAKASEYATGHSWRKVAQETVDIYQEAILDVERLAHHAPHS
jgi:glycosyltransferase involved in cell wall biosynthesis